MVGHRSLSLVDDGIDAMAGWLVIPPYIIQRTPRYGRLRDERNGGYSRLPISENTRISAKIRAPRENNRAASPEDSTVPSGVAIGGGVFARGGPHAVKFFERVSRNDRRIGSIAMRGLVFLVPRFASLPRFVKHVARIRLSKRKELLSCLSPSLPPSLYRYDRNSGIVGFAEKHIS